MAEVDVGQSLQCAILLLAANQAVDGLPCALLPEGRLAITVAALLTYAGPVPTHLPHYKLGV